MSKRQKTRNSAAKERLKNNHYVIQRLKDIYLISTEKYYSFYTPKKIRIKKWVEPAIYFGSLILIGKSKPIGKNIILAEMYNRQTVKQKK